MKSDFACRFLYNNIKIHVEFGDGIEKHILRNTIRHQEAWLEMKPYDAKLFLRMDFFLVMLNGVPQDGFFPHDAKWCSSGRIFLYHPHTNTGFFFLHTIKYGNCIFKKSPRSWSELMSYLIPSEYDFFSAGQMIGQGVYVLINVRP